MMAFCTQGIRKCVPSLTTPSFTPARRSKMTARFPPLTSYIAACPTATATKTGTAHLEMVLRTAGLAISKKENRGVKWMGKGCKLMRLKSGSYLMMFRLALSAKTECKLHKLHKLSTSHVRPHSYLQVQKAVEARCLIAGPKNGRAMDGSQRPSPSCNHPNVGH